MLSGEQKSFRVFPAYAGVFLALVIASPVELSLPRIRGGVSLTFAKDDDVKESSPHTRGCFLGFEKGSGRFRVFPAYAGVFLWRKQRAYERCRLPRIRGGVS